MMLSAALVPGVPAIPVQAASTSTTFEVTTTVAAACSITASDMAFGNYTGGQAIDAASTLTVTCTNGTEFKLGLNQGTGAGATTSNRMMTGPAGSTLGYGLYQDGSRSIAWGNDVIDSVVSTGTGLAQMFTVYGRVPAGQTPRVGSFADTITATVLY